VHGMGAWGGASRTCCGTSREVPAAAAASGARRRRAGVGPTGEVARRLAGRRGRGGGSGRGRRLCAPARTSRTPRLPAAQ